VTGKATKTDALIRDVAKLFVAYPMAVWRPLIDDLDKGGDVQARVGAAIVEILEKMPSPKPKRSTASSRRRKEAVARKPTSIAAAEPSFVPERAEALGLLSDELANRRVLPRLPELRRLYLDVGGKLELPRDRKAACGVLLAHLSEVSDEAFSRALVTIREGTADAGAVDAYARWFRLIRPNDGVERQPELDIRPSAPAQPGSGSSPKPKPV
jgi:hypothetical protein